MILLSTISINNCVINRLKCFRMQSSITFYYNDVYKQPLPDGHRFPMEKYRLVREKLQNELEVKGVKFEVSPLATREELSTTHCSQYVNNFLTGNLTQKEIRKTGFPWSHDGVRRSISSVGGTVAAMRKVLSSSDICSGHIAGGTHHAFKNYGEGFCIFSDIAVATNIALKEYKEKCKTVAIIDLDVHQGNGNAVLFQDDERVFTFSMHCKENYFSNIQKSDLDVEVPANANDDDYCSLLEKSIDLVFEKINPDLVFFQAGVDIHHHDRLGKLKVTRQGIQRRNSIVYNKVKDVGSKIVICMGGGYPKNHHVDSVEFQEIVDSHCDCYINALTFLK